MYNHVGWRGEQQRENEQTMTTLILMFVMVWLSAVGGVELAGAVAMMHGSGSGSNERR